MTRYLVTGADRAGDLLGVLTLELEKSVSGIYGRLKDASGDSDTTFIRAVARELDTFDRQVNNLRGALAYLDRLYIKELDPEESIRCV